MANQKNPENSHHKLQILFLLALALYLSIAFKIGSASNESLEFSESAFGLLVQLKVAFSQFQLFPALTSLQESYILISAQYEIPAVLSLLPTAIIFHYLGVNEFASILFPLSASLLSILLFYALASQLYNKNSALIAAFIWALLPARLFLSTQALPYTLPTLLLLLCIYLELREPNKWKFTNSLLLWALSAILLVQNLWLGLALLVWLLLRRSTPNLKIELILPLLSMVLIIIQPDRLENLFANLSQFLLQPGNFLLIAFSLVAFADQIWSEHKTPRSLQQLGLSLMWLAILPMLMIAPDPEKLYWLNPIIFLPSILLMGKYVDVLIPERAQARFPILLGLLILLSTFGLSAAYGRSIPLLAGLSPNALVYILDILSGISLIAIIISPLYFAGKDKQSAPFLGMLLISSLLLALLGMTARNGRDLAVRNQAAISAYAQLRASESEFPINILADRRLKNQFRFLSAYAEDFASRLLVIDSSELEEIRNGYVLYWNEDVSDLPINWALLDVFGQAGKNQLNLVQAFSSEYAQGQLEGLPASRLQDLLKLSQLSANAGYLCDSISYWMDAAALEETRIRTLPIDLASLAACSRLPNMRDLSAELPANKAARYLEPKLSSPANGAPQELRISRKYTYYQDPRIFNYPAILQANSIYLYSLSVMAEEAVSLLYWGTAHEEGAFGGGRFPDWTSKSILIATPNWPSPQEIMLSPVIFDHFGQTQIRDFHFEILE